MESAGVRYLRTSCWRIRNRTSEISDTKTTSAYIERFHSRGQHLCKFIGTKESVCIRKEFISPWICLGHQYDSSDVMWTHSIQYEALSMWYCVIIYILRHSLFWQPFISDFSKCLNLPLHTAKWQTKRSISLSVKTLVNNLMRERIWGNLRIKSRVNFLYWMHNWKWMNLSKIGRIIFYVWKTSFVPLIG